MTFTCSVKGFVCIERFGLCVYWKVWVCVYWKVWVSTNYVVVYFLFVLFAFYSIFCFLCFPWTDFYDFVFHCWVFSSSSLFFFFFSSIHILVPFKIQHSILNLLLSTFKYVTSVLWKDLKIVYFHFFVIFVWLCKNEKK